MESIKYSEVKNNRSIRMIVEKNVADVVGLTPGDEIIQDAFEKVNPVIVIKDDGFGAYIHPKSLKVLFQVLQQFITEE